MNAKIALGALIQLRIWNSCAVRQCYPPSGDKISSQAEAQGPEVPCYTNDRPTRGRNWHARTAVIADCIEKSKATTDEELITDYITETLGVLQIDNTEEDAFHMLGSAIADAVADDEAHTACLLDVWSELEEQRRLA